MGILLYNSKKERGGILQISVTLSANAGVSICAAGHRIWIDAIHHEKEPGFSAVTPQLQRQLLHAEAFQNPGHILFTHCHPDHYSRDLTAAAASLWPKAKLYLPESAFPEQVLITGQSVAAEEDLTFSFYKLPHEGRQYADVAHYGVILRIQDKNILIAGDCATASAALADALAGEKIHLAILNFPWITLKKGRQFLQTHLPDSQLLICHLPFAQDDINGYRQAAQKVAKDHPNARLLLEPLQAENLII